MLNVFDLMATSINTQAIAWGSISDLDVLYGVIAILLRSLNYFVN
ncbi:hypothetical protein Vsou_01970 [Vulcanisaeta souniana JCM 11219]|uniref:Uncharacterized protein n=1 Tax=Vulcanisaeta souniana JCM 11219 TaxID=1293586 RepID=A0ABN6SP04_9CREN|nr:hypothetical protein Vsou_01970 [Vulcanisaeta souniana JCM 11219]